MGASVIDGTILQVATGEQPFDGGPVTTEQTADNKSTDAETFDSSPVVTGSHWADIIEADAKQVTAAEVEDKSVKARRRAQA